MGNVTNMENWAARERLRAVECAVWWRGWVQRRDLVELFGVSAAQASSDLQRYQQLNPGALAYQMQRKRYEGVETMSCVLHEPSLEEAMARFLGGGEGLGWSVGLEVEGDNGVGEVLVGRKVAVSRPPLRRVPRQVARRVFMAVAEGKQVQINYFGVSRGEAAWRVILPHAFGHDGLRWHVRAWCVEAQGWRDFVLGRILAADWPAPVSRTRPKDTDWEEIIELKLRVNPELSEAAQAALALDYGAENGVLTMRCRRAMEQYVRAMLRVPGGELELPGHFVEHDLKS